MIPKIIHYCWFGRNPLPPLAVKCIESWKKFLPDYEIKEWNEDNFDVNSIPYTREAYEARKYAFVSDYARFYILYHHGGLYFDTDVEVIQPMDDIIGRGAFMGCASEAYGDDAFRLAVAPGLGLGCNQRQGLYTEILELYSKLNFIDLNGSYNMTTVVDYTTEILCKHGLRVTNEVQEIEEIFIYPKDYFCPIDEHTNLLNITPNTRSIHHYAASWHSSKHKIFKYVAGIIGKDTAHKIAVMMKRLKLVK